MNSPYTGDGTVQTDLSFERRVSAVGAGLVEVRGGGAALELWLGSRFVGKQRMQARIVGGVLAACGIVATVLSPWSLLLTAVGLAVLVGAPALFRQRALITINRETGWMWGMGNSDEIEVARISQIRGTHEIQGWDPRDVILAEMDDGSRVEVISFRGTNEALALDACRALAQEIGRPTDYTDQYGNRTTC